MTPEESVAQVLRTFVHAGLIEHNPEKVLACMTDDIVGIGMGEQGLVVCLEDARRVMLSGAKEEDDARYALDFRRMETRFHSSFFASACAEIVVIRTDRDGTTASGLMQSATLRQEKGAWKICAIHASPMLLSQESIDAYPLKFAENTLAHLRTELQSQAFSLMNQSLPGGLVGAYQQPGFPLYFINDGMLTFLGFTREELEEQTGGLGLNIIHPDDRDFVRRTVEDALRDQSGKGEYKVRHRVMKKDGSVAWMLQRGRRSTDDEGRDVVLAVYVDVTEIVALQTELEQHAAALQEKNLELQTLTDNVPGGVSVMRLDDRLTLLYANPCFYELTGYTPDQVRDELNNEWVRCIYPDDVALVMDSVLNTYKKGVPHFEFEARLIRRQGGVIWGLIRGSYIRTASGVSVHSVTVDITERKHMERELQLSEERFRIALKKTSTLIFDYDIAHGAIVLANGPDHGAPSSTSIERARYELLPGATILPEYREEFAAAFARIQGGAHRSECVIKSRLRDGETRWNSISMTALQDAQGRTIRAVGMIEDVTRRKEAELAYTREEQFRRAVLADAMASYDINFSRDAFEDCKVDSPLCVVVKPGDPYERLVRDVTMDRLVEEDRHAFVRTFCRSSVLRAFERKQREIRLEYRFIQPGGSVMWLETTLRLVLDADSGEKKGFMYVMNIDQRKKAQLALTRKSECDSLTGVYNKRTAEARIREQLKTDEGIQTGAFMMIDLDRFKAVNDTCGHPFGDTVLIRAARTVREHFRENDIVGRLGGDEFCVFFCGIRNRKRIEEAARELCEAFRALYTPPADAPAPSCSIGIALTGGVAKSFDQLYAEADRALYRAKKNGRDGYAFADQEPETPPCRP